MANILDEINEILFNEGPDESYWDDLLSRETNEAAELLKLEELMLSERDPFFKGDRRISPALKAELEAELDFFYAGCTNNWEDPDFDFNENPLLSCIELESVEDPGLWGRPITRNSNLTISCQNGLELSHEDSKRVLKNLRTVYSSYAINIAMFIDPKMIDPFIGTLVNIAGYREHYGEQWMEQFIPTIKQLR